MTDPADTITRTLPKTEEPGRFELVPLGRIVASPTNPRKTFNPAKLQELADSITATGVHQPILLRPLPAARVPETGRQVHYELVCGERRFRASHLAKQAHVPAIVRHLTDAQVLEIQVIENLQRDDLSELEEAEGYDYLMRQANMQADQVAKKIGKSKSYVYARLKLLALCPEGKEAMRRGDLDASRALLVARIPDTALQVAALEHIEDLSYREAAYHIQITYMLRLDRAAWPLADASLLPEAGACTTCTKRTGANPDLFSEVKEADTCIDTPCFRRKEEAFRSQTLKVATERGQQVIEGREAKALMPSKFATHIEGYRRLDNRSDSPTDQPLRKLLGPAMKASGVQPTVLVNPYDETSLIEVLAEEQVAELLQLASSINADAKAAAKALKEQRAASSQAADRAQAEEARIALENAWRRETLLQTWNQIKSGTHEAPSDAVLRHVALTMAQSMTADRCKDLCKILDLGKVAPQAALLDYIKDTATPGDALQLLVMHSDVTYKHWLPQEYQSPALCLIASDYGVDPQQIKTSLTAKAQAEREAATPAAAGAKHFSGGGGGKPKKQNNKSNTATTPAPRITQDQAIQGIAAAMQGLEAGTAVAAPETATPGAALAAQGQEGAALDGASSAPQGPGLAPDQPADTIPSFQRDQLVRVRLDAKGPAGKRHKCCGYVGIVEGTAGACVVVVFGPKSSDRFADLLPNELEHYTADPVVGKRVKVIKAGLLANRNKFRWRHGTVSACTETGWQVTFHDPRGGLPVTAEFGTEELESLQ